MNKSEILKLGWGTFGLFFLLGNICLLGFTITRNFDFAFSGYLLLIFGSVLNLMIFLLFIIFSFTDKKKCKILEVVSVYSTYQYSPCFSVRHYWNNNFIK